MTDRDPFSPLDEQDERLTSVGAHHQQDVAGDDEIIMPVPEYAEPLRQALKRDWGRKPSDVWWYCDVDGWRSFAVVRFDDVDGKKYYPFCWVRSATSEGWKARSVPAPRPLFNLNRLAARPDAPVLVVEGEKCVRDAEKVFPDWVVVTSLGGAHATAKTDWAALTGRPEAMIWPDADKAGSDYANDVGLHLQNVGMSNIRVVDANALAGRMPDGTTREPPLGWDVADAVEEGWNLDVLREAVLANATGFEIGPRYVSFDNFAMDAGGLKVTVPKSNGEIATSETKWVCAPFEILGRARDPKGEGWARLIRWQDDDGRVHTDTISDEDLHGDVPALCARLAHCGLRIGTGKFRPYLIGYLNDAVVEDRVTVVTRTGWHDIGAAKVFALPDETIGLVVGETVILQGASQTAFESEGTLADWQDGVGSLVAGHSLGEFAVSVAFAGPVLGLLGQQGVGFNLYGQSSCGKTTTVEAAASVWGKGASPGFVLSWRSTANALEAAAAIHTDTLFVLDELGVVEAKEAATAVYQLTSGTGKKRLKRDSTLRPPLTWRTMVLSTGEMRMADKLIEGNLRARAGQQVRLIDIPADAGMGFGVFSHAGADGDAKVLADTLKIASRTSYGTAGPEFVRRLIANGVDKSTDAIEATIKTFQKHYTPPSADPQVLRVCDHFGLVAAAGELARELGVVHWKAAAAIEAARQCFADWLENRGGAEAGEVQAAISQVRLFIEQHGDSRFEPADAPPPHPVNNRAGWYKGGGVHREWLIPPETWKAEVALGLDPQLVARVLADRGMLIRGNDGGLTRVMKIHGKSMRVYVVKASILAGTDNE
jgi:putative DNA primase/helicase